MMNLKFTGIQKISIKNYITAILWLILLGVFLCIWPGGMVTNHVVSKSVADYDSKTGPLTAGLPIIQEFVPQYEKLQSVGFVLYKNEDTSQTGTVVFKIFDAAIQPVFETRIAMADIENGSFTDVEVGIKVDRTLPYYFRIETEGADEQPPVLGYRSLSGCGPVENQTLYYGSTILEDASPVCRYEYGAPLGVLQVLTYASFLVLLGALLTAWIQNNGAGYFKKEYGTIVWLKISGSLLGAVLFGTAGYFLIVANVFKADRLDKIVYGAALLFSAILWIAGMFDGIPRIWKGISGELQKKNWGPTLRTVLFAVICILGMYYFNSGSNHGHAIATRYILLCFAGIVATFYKRRQLLRKETVMYIAVCLLVFAGFALLKGIEEGKELQYGLNAAVAVCWGSLIIRLMINLKEKRIRKLSAGYAAILFLFFMLLILFRNTRDWVFTATIPFTVLYLQDLEDKDWKKLMQEFCNGVVLSFFLILGFSLLFRPYHRYNYSRYPLAFFSVATCSLYLIVVFIGALTNYAAGLQKNGKFRENLWKLLILGTVFCYTFMTVSRTAMLALGSAGVLLFILLGMTWYKQKMKSLLLQMIWIGAALLFIFPVAFTATRSIPALIGHPFIMGGELWEETITAEDAMDSPKYMNMYRFLELNFDKLIKNFEKSRETGRGKDIFLYAASDPFLPVTLYAKDVTADTWYNESEGTIGNGRLEIYGAYLRNLNLTGHDEMMLEENDMIYYHAHNTFLQAAYDHGVPVGIYFVLLGIVSIVRAVSCFMKKGKENPYTMLPVLVITAFGAASLTEWTFHPSILLGFALLLVQAPLLGKTKPQQRQNEE